ncbi:DgyrCDS6792 [Dimorphilus gyrociliatus]|uniref:DgyrCDS6792 n=1 Tax=Dimorphilus gyrociliatus TaxID=2664684 RepID=A0A7I8VP24_9ANNE|nr:DgyrCDS6792 [Dimorphilus gyrociliatus]
MASLCYACKKKINKQKRGVCSLCKHTTHWVCLNDGFCEICLKINNYSLQIVLRRCDENTLTAKLPKRIDHQEIFRNNQVEATADDINDHLIANNEKDKSANDGESIKQIEGPIDNVVIKNTQIPQREVFAEDVTMEHLNTKEDYFPFDHNTNQPEDSSFEDVDDVVLRSDGSFKIFQNGSQKGKPLLVHDGFSYTIKNQRNKSRIWRCSGNNNKQDQCPGSVNENDGNFTLGSKSHNHSPKLNLKEIIDMKVTIKQRSEMDTQTSAKRIVEDKFIQKQNISNFPSSKGLNWWLLTKKICLDYEKAIWKSVAKYFPETEIKGCLFHWTQAIFRKIQELGYSSDYKKHTGQWTEMKLLMGLPFLPADIIPQEFNKIKAHLNTLEKLSDLLHYVENT